MSKQGAAGKRKHAALIISQNMEIIGRLESGKCCSVIVVAYNVGLSAHYYVKNQKRQLQSSMALAASPL
jgi:hypothetical protein